MLNFSLFLSSTIIFFYAFPAYVQNSILSAAEEISVNNVSSYIPALSLAVCTSFLFRVVDFFSVTLTLPFFSFIMSRKDEYSVQEYSVETTVVDDIDSSIQEVLNDEAIIKNPAFTEQLEHADELEDQPIDIVRSTVRTIDNPSLPVYT
jgi:hypothetical protein